MFISTEDDSPLPVIDFSLKRAIINSDFFPFTGEMGAAGGGKVVGREKEIAPGPCNSDRRGCEQEPEGETKSETVLTALFSLIQFQAIYYFLQRRYSSVSFLGSF